MIVRPKTSFYFIILIVLMNFGALSSLFFIALPLWVLLLLASVIVMYFAYAVLRYGLLRSSWSIQTVILKSDSTAEIIFNNQATRHSATLLDYYFMTRFLIILYFKIENCLLPSVVILFADAEATEILRRLRAWLWMRK
jgi:hypothetical protein